MKILPQSFKHMTRAIGIEQDPQGIVAFIASPVVVGKEISIVSALTRSQGFPIAGSSRALLW
jgi:hypothetical protein